MSDQNLKTVFIGAFFGIIGVVIGSVTTGYLNLLAEREKLRLDAALDSFKWDEADRPVEFIQLKQLVDEMRNLSYSKPETIKELAMLQRKYPNCGDTLSEECRPFMVEAILIYRKELGAGEVSARDVDTILQRKYETARKALESFSK